MGLGTEDWTEGRVEEGLAGMELWIRIALTKQISNFYFDLRVGDSSRSEMTLKTNGGTNLTANTRTTERMGANRRAECGTRPRYSFSSTKTRRSRVRKETARLRDPRQPTNIIWH
jgi:hypothetical protein